MTNFAARIVPLAAVLAGAALGASSGLYIKGLAFSSLAMTGFRMAVPFLIVLPWVTARRRRLGLKGHPRRLVVTSAVNAVRMLLYILAYKLTSIGNAIVLLYLWPIFALVLDTLRSRRALDPARLGVLAAASVGVVFLNVGKGLSLSPEDLLGSLSMILSSLIFAGTAMVYKEALAERSELETLYYQNGIGAFVYLPFLLAELPGAAPAQIGLGLVYGTSVGLIGFGLFFVAMKRLPLFQYSALAYSEVLFGLFVGIAFKGETLSAVQVVGMVLILVGSLSAQRLRTA